MPRAKFQIERKCKICGKPFMALIIESQYCSPACGQKAYKIRKREQKRNEELQQVIEGLDSDRDFITVPEAIALFAVGRQTLYHYIRSGKIPSVNYNPQIQISVVSGTKRSIFRQKNKTKRSKKRLHTTLIKPEQKVNEDLCSGFIVS